MKYTFSQIINSNMKSIRTYEKSSKSKGVYEFKLKPFYICFNYEETLQENIINKKQLIDKIKKIKNDLIKSREIKDLKNVVLCYKYFFYFPKSYSAGINLLSVVCIEKKENGFYVFNEFVNTSKDLSELYSRISDFEGVQKSIKEFGYKKFDEEEIANEIIFDLINDTELSSWNYEIDTEDKGLNFEFCK